MKKLVLASLVVLTASFQPIFAGTETILPPEIHSQLRSGGKLDQIWINPKYDVASGFIIGRVDTHVDAATPGASYLGSFKPALKRLEFPGSRNVLNVTILSLSTMERPLFSLYGATMEVEGSVVDPQGRVMFAFSTLADSKNRETVEKNCLAIADQVAWGIYRDLGKRFRVAQDLLLKKGPEKADYPVPPPPAQTGSLTARERLMELDNLRKSGLINDEDFNKHKEEILKGM